MLLPIKNYHRCKTSCLFTFPSFKIIKIIDIAKINFQFVSGVFTTKIDLYKNKTKVVCGILEPFILSVVNNKNNHIEKNLD